TWWSDLNGEFNIWPHQLSTYHLHPIGAAQQPTCPTPNMVSGSRVQPAAGAMNLRAAPNGDVIGRVDSALVIFGEPVCDNGANWWQTDQGGFIAGNDPATGYTLLIPAVPETTADMPQDESTTGEVPQDDPTAGELPQDDPTTGEIPQDESAAGELPQDTSSEPEPTREPETVPEPTREPETVPEPTREPDIPSMELDLSAIATEPPPRQGTR
ncbi:MAG: hypothetical protein AAF653_16460, partial [Chloroflexota bacterium]